MAITPELKKPTLRERFVKDHPLLAYYGGLVRRSPRLVSGAATDVERWMGVIVLAVAAASATFSATQQQYQLAALIIGLLVLVGFVRLNYQEIVRREREIAHVRRSLNTMFVEQHVEPFHARLIADLLDSEMYGYREMVRKLDRGEGTHSELTAEFDHWDSSVARHLALIDEAEVGFFQRPVEATLMEGDWGDRIRALLEVRKSRLEEIHIRQKGRHERGIAERKKKDEKSKAISR